MRKDDLATAVFYQDTRVVGDYETIRYGSRAGRIADELQKQTILRALSGWDLKGKCVLDVGCGPGRLTRWLHSLGAQSVGVDLSLPMLSAARARDNGSSYARSNALRLPFKDQQFDLGLSVWVYNHLASYREAIAEVSRVSRRVLLALPNQDSLLGLTYAWRYLRGYNREYSGFTIRKYNGAPIPYSIYFKARDLKLMLEQCGFYNIRIESCLFTFMLPPIVSGLSARCDQRLSRWFPHRGTFMVMVGERK